MGRQGNAGWQMISTAHLNCECYHKEWMHKDTGCMKCICKKFTPRTAKARDMYAKFLEEKREKV
jgi:hypothetical protein